jgi:hypothetical protein
MQLLWTWTCSLTEGLPVTSLAWSSTNTNLLAAGYAAGTGQQQQQGDSTAAAAAAAAAAPPAGPLSAAAARGVQQGQQQQSDGALLPLANGSADGGAGDDGLAADGGGVAVGGRVALWSLKNQFHPVWSFATKAGVRVLWARLCHVLPRLPEETPRQHCQHTSTPCFCLPVPCRRHQPGFFAAQPPHAGRRHARRHDCGV